jgi:hypothetical protein
VSNESNDYVITSNEPALEATLEPVSAIEKTPAITQEPESKVETNTEEVEAEKPKRDAQSRIRELNERAKAAETELAILKAAQTAKTETTAPVGKPNPNDYAGGLFNQEYQDAIETWREAETERKISDALTKREQDEIQKAEKKAFEQRKQTIEAKEDAFRAATPDYDDALSRSGELFDNPLLAQAIPEIDNIFEVAYQIGKDEDLLAEFASLSPMQQLVKLGALSATLSGQQPAAKTAAKNISHAPKPITPISGGSAVTTPEQALDGSDYEAYKAARLAQRGKK